MTTSDFPPSTRKKTYYILNARVFFGNKIIIILQRNVTCSSRSLSHCLSVCLFVCLSLWSTVSSPPMRKPSHNRNNGTKRGRELPLVPTRRHRCRRRNRRRGQPVKTTVVVTNAIRVSLVLVYLRGNRLPYRNMLIVYHTHSRTYTTYTTITDHHYYTYIRNIYNNIMHRHIMRAV